jgi:glycerol-3-phosphate acyltransferase PlsX
MQTVIALDCMGGDNAPDVVIQGISLYLNRIKSIQSPNYLKFLLFGDELVIKQLLDKYKINLNFCQIHHTDVSIKNEDKPSEVIRSLSGSSMHLAINAVKEQQAQAVVSAGNTGALMAISKIYLKMIQGIERPSIITFLPTKKDDSPCAILDLGANAECSPSNLHQFAIMGDAFYRAFIPNSFPKVALLNIGSEVLKGNDLVKKTADLISTDNTLNYIGYAEPNNIFSGLYDVIVTDGFTGNVALKSIEGTTSFITNSIKSIFKKNLYNKIITFLGLPLIYILKKTVDARKYNGAMLIGLNGICIKSHGNADGFAFSYAIESAIKLVKNNVNEKIKNSLTHLHIDNKKIDNNETN